MKKCKRYPVPYVQSSPPVLAKPSQLIQADARIEDYLDHVFAPLVDKLSYERRRELRAELRVRLQTAVAEFVSVGVGIDQALDKAIEAIEHLAPERTVARPRGNWFSRLVFGDSTVLIPSARRSFYNGAWFFGIASILLLMQNSPYGVVDINFWTVLLLPLIAGFVTSMRSSKKPVLGSFYALIAAGLATTAFQFFGNPRAANMTFLLYLLFWLPIGCLGAFAGAKARPAILAALRRHSEQAVPSPE